MNNTVRRYYDHGWNARCRNEPLIRPATRDYIDGWRDCDEAPIEVRIPFKDGAPEPVE